MIVKIASNARQALQHRNTRFLQVRFIANTGLHQQFRRVDGTQTEDDFTRGFGVNRLSLVVELNAGGAAAIEQNAHRHRAG
jgi:hypothetical protein